MLDALKSLATFAAVMEAGSFRGAAGRLRLYEAGQRTPEHQCWCTILDIVTNRLLVNHESATNQSRIGY